MTKISLSIVSYTNTLPFKIGIESNKELLNMSSISYDTPAICSEKLLTNKTDIGLVPVTTLLKLSNYEIISNFCIGTNKIVDSVNLYSNVPLSEINTIILDYQSQTSINLVKVLSKFYWKIAPQFINGKKGFEVHDIKNKTAGVIIGDRTFNLVNKYKYTYDLANEWYSYTKLPFVFALWVSNKTIPKVYKTIFTKALENGINNINNIAHTHKSNFPKEFNLTDYLNNKISYIFDKEKQKALKLFLEHIKELNSTTL